MCKPYRPLRVNGSFFLKSTVKPASCSDEHRPPYFEPTPLLRVVYADAAFREP